MIAEINELKQNVIRVLEEQGFSLIQDEFLNGFTIQSEFIILGIKKMFRCRWFLTILVLGILALFWASSSVFAQADYSLSLSQSVLADPGEEGVCLYLVLSSIDSVAGFEVLLKFNPQLLTPIGVEPACRFQLFGYDFSSPDEVRIIARRHVPDSTYLPPLPPGRDTLGYISVSVISQDLLVDLETPVEFMEDPETSDPDNRLITPDSSFIEEPDLELTHGSVFIRHPLYGDVNDDGYPYTIADAIFFLNFLAGRQGLTPRQRANSDVTRDGVQASMSDFIHLVTIITEN
jgi:hypothetical protein